MRYILINYAYGFISVLSFQKPNVILAEAQPVKMFDMVTCTIEESRGLALDDELSSFDFDISDSAPISGFAGWFTSDFKSRTDANGADAPKLMSPAFLDTGPEAGYTHWGQQVFHLLSSIPVLPDQKVRIYGNLELMRTKENARLYNCRFRFKTSRRNESEPKDGKVLMESDLTETVYQIP